MELFHGGALRIFVKVVPQGLCLQDLGRRVAVGSRARQHAREVFILGRDDAVAARLNTTMGKRVALTYEQHIGVPSSCFGETQYFVTDVKEVANQ